MDLIAQRSRIFKRLVKSDFMRSFDLKNVNIQKLFSNTNCKNLIYSKGNYLLVHNSILNDKFKQTILKKDCYSLVFILYKNINYIKKDEKYTARLDSTCKRNIKRIVSKYIHKYEVNDDIIIIGRKYIDVKDSNDKNMNCMSMFCTYNVRKFNFKNDTLSDDKYPDDTNSTLSDDTNSTLSDDTNSTLSDATLSNGKNITKSVMRRKFLNNLENFINDDNFKIRSILDYSIFFDTEYTNDIYDDFKSFPISKDSSILFMIGVTCKTNYKNYTVKKLCQNDEKEILQQFLNFLISKQKNQKSIYLFHWSNADKYILDKTLSRYPDIQENYKNVIDSIKYIDLLKIVKQTLTGLPSYSLKYVCKYLFNKEYETDCKNGFDAMCYIIQSNNKLDRTKKQTLSDLEVTKDIIAYNKMDTVLLYDIFNYFFKN